jgi:hypothetical protein
MLLSIFLFAITALAAEEREITVTLTVPDSAWAISIEEVHEVKNEIWVISNVSRDPDVMGAQVISVVRDAVIMVAPDLPVKHFVIGKTWNWKNEEAYTFIENRNNLDSELISGKRLYKRKNKIPGDRQLKK